MSTRSLAIWIQRGLLLLVAIMPFHAFLSVWLGSITGYQALWQSWKEILALLLVGLTGWLLWKTSDLRAKLADPLFYSLGAYVLVSGLVSLLAQPAFIQILYGAKTNFEFLALFVIAYIVASLKLRTLVLKLILATSAVVIGFSLLQLFVLPPNFLSWFGYGPDTILPYQLVDPAVEAIRISSTLGGPLQLGSFLIIPLSIVFARLLKRPQLWQVIYLAAGLIAIWGSHTRSAWLGLAASFAVIGVTRLPRRWRLPSLLGLVLAGGVALQLLISNASVGNLQYYLFHGSLNDTGITTSTDQHSQAVTEGINRIQEQPLGYGLGTAGPASYESAHPFATESYYLQVGVEAGVIGLLLFGLFSLIAGWRLWKFGRTDWAAIGAFGALVGISVFNFFLHGWTDSSTAMVFWILVGTILGSGYTKPKKQSK